MTRREMLRNAGAAALLAEPSLYVSAAYREEASPVAETRCGKVRGAAVQGVLIFRGIPYGGPTKGAARFLPPSKAAEWKGVRDATVTGPRCVQGPGNIFLDPLIGAYFSGGRADRVDLARQTDSEDCLVLNVLTPACKVSGR